jgi:hypothetical protein
MLTLHTSTQPRKDKGVPPKDSECVVIKPKWGGLGHVSMPNEVLAGAKAERHGVGAFMTIAIALTMVFHLGALRGEVMKDARPSPF